MVVLLLGERGSFERWNRWCIVVAGKQNAVEQKQKGRKDDRLLAQRLVCMHVISIDFVDLMMIFCCDALRLPWCVKATRRRTKFWYGELYVVRRPGRL